MKKLVILNKKEGETPLESLEKFRFKNKIPENVPMTYAGRLDPMASGLLIVLTGEECKKKEKYLKLDKEYEFQVLFGFTTDTYDILGKITHSNIPRPNDRNLSVGQVTNYRIGELEKSIKKEIKKFKGNIIQKYPIYSSKVVLGKPLFSYARKGEDVEIPEREVYIKELKFLKIKKIDNRKLLDDIQKRINKVKGDFRQKEIIKLWKKELKNKNTYLITDFKIKCSSGTYVRSIANSLGYNLKIPSLAFSIKRTKVGKWSKTR